MSVRKYHIICLNSLWKQIKTKRNYAKSLKLIKDTIGNKMYKAFVEKYNRHS